MDNDNLPEVKSMTRRQIVDEINTTEGTVARLTKRGGSDLKGLNDDEADELGGHLDRLEDLRGQLDKLPDPRDAVKSRMPAPAAATGSEAKSVSGTGNAAVAKGETEDEATKFFKRGPFKSLGHVMHSVRQAGERPAVNPNGVIAEWMGGISRHDEAIKSIAACGVEDQQVARDIKSATGISEFADSDGAMLIPIEFAAGIQERMLEGEGLYNRLSPIPLAGNAIKIRGYEDSSRAGGVLYGGVQAFWTGEAEQYQASRPKFRDVELRLEKLTVMVGMTDEMMQDAPAMQAENARIVARTMRFKLESALFAGSGVKMPQGMLNQAARVSVAKEAGQASTTLVAANVDKMWARRVTGSDERLVWFYNQDIEPQLQQLNYAPGTGGTIVAQLLYMPAGGISGKPYASLKGRPLLNSEFCETLGTEGDLILVDPDSIALAVKSTGVENAMSTHLRFDYGEVMFRWSIRMDARNRWEKPLTRFKGAANLAPVVTLQAR